MKNKLNLTGIWLYLAFFILMLLDAHLTKLFGIWDHGNNIWQSELLLLTMFFASYRLSKGFMITVAVIMGMIFDLYYLGVIGIYAVAMPLLIWSIYLFHKYYYQNVLTLFFSWIICVSLYQMIILLIQVIFKLNIFSIEPFIVHSFGPTLLVNILLFFILLLPLSKIFKVDILLITSYKKG